MEYQAIVMDLWKDESIPASGEALFKYHEEFHKKSFKQK